MAEKKLQVTNSPSLSPSKGKEKSSIPPGIEFTQVNFSYDDDDVNKEVNESCVSRKSVTLCLETDEKNSSTKSDALTVIKKKKKKNKKKTQSEKQCVEEICEEISVVKKKKKKSKENHSEEKMSKESVCDELINYSLKSNNCKKKKKHKKGKDSERQNEVGGNNVIVSKEIKKGVKRKKSLNDNEVTSKKVKLIKS